jgi:type IV pilus assembly protein PilM
MSTGSTSSSRTSASWPTIAQYNEAVQNLATSMSDPELQAGEAVPGPLGVPMPFAGQFADVYKVRCPQTNNTWALKFFKHEVRDLRERYRAISECLHSSRLPFTVDFRYLEQGVRIGGHWFPLLKMRWVEGQNLNRFVAQTLHRPKMLEQLGGLWVKVAAGLREAGIAHADLQHGNVVLVPEAEGGRLLLKLIDYDGMYVPALSGQKPGEVGHPAYQHPRRLREGIYSAEVDRFSHLSICCALRCLSVGRKQLWDRFDNGDNLLFTEQDFSKPSESNAFRELWTINDDNARALVGHLALATQRPLEQIPLVDELMRDGEVRPLTEVERRSAKAVIEGRVTANLQELAAENAQPLQASAPTATATPPPPAAAQPAAPPRQPQPSQPAATNSSGWNWGKALWGGGESRRAWGIDIGQCSLKALCCERRDDGSVAPVAFDFIDYPRALERVNYESIFRAVLSQFSSRNSTSGATIVVSVSGKTAISRFIKLPPVEEKKIADIIKFEAKQQIPFPLDEVIWDFQKVYSSQIVDGFALDTEVALFALKRDQIDQVLLPFQAAKITVDIVQLIPVAIHNLLALDLGWDSRSAKNYDRDSPPESLAAIAMGADSSDLVISDGVQLWIRSIAMGGNHFTRAISKDLKLTFAKAEALKRNVMRAEDPKAVFQAMRPVFNDLAGEVQRSLGYYSNTHKKATLRRLTLLGGPTRLPGLRKFLTEKLQLEITDLSLMQQLGREPGLQSPMFQENGISFGPSYGLCLQGLQLGMIQTNLLPPERRAGLMNQLRGWFGKKK